MKKKLHRITSVLLALLLAISFAACNAAPAEEATSTSTATTDSAEEATVENFNATGYPIVNEPITLTVAGALNPLAETWEGMDAFAYLTENTGIEFEYDEYTSDVWAERKSLLFASNDLPDMFINAAFTMAEVSEYSRSGQLLPLAGLVDQYGENIQAAFDITPIAKAMSTDESGEIYTLPLINPNPRDMHIRYWINEVWLENVGLDIPETLDELYEVLVAFKEQDANGNGDPNDEIPASGESGESFDGLVLNAVGINTYDPQFQIVAQDDGTVALANTLPEYKEYLLYMNKLYSEGLLDQDLFVQTVEQFNAKGYEDVLGSYEASASFLTSGPDVGYNFSQFDALTSHVSDEKMTTAFTGVSVGKGAITSANEYPEATLRLFDFGFTDEASRVLNMGREGLGWDWVDEEAGTWGQTVPEGYDNSQEWRAEITPIVAFPSYWNPEFQGGTIVDSSIWLNEMTAEYSQDYFKTLYPTLNFTDDEFDQMSSTINDITTYIQGARARFITGEESIEDGWDAYVEQIENMGIQTVIDIHQPKYEAFIASMG